VAGPRAQRATVSLDTQVAWILRLEHQRVLRDPTTLRPGVAEAATGLPGASPAFVPATVPDLEVLAADPDARVRRRTALAIGRVGLDEGADSLGVLLGDPDEGVRESAAFGMGLLGASTGVPRLIAALADSSARVRGRVIEALGRLGDESSARIIADGAGGCAAVLAPIAPDDETWPLSPEVEVCRLTLFALVRLGDDDALARVVLDAEGRPVSRWWPVAFAIQRGGLPRPVALLTLVSSPGVYTPAFALRGLAALGDRNLVPLARAIVTEPANDVRLRIAAVRALGAVNGAEVGDVLLPLIRDIRTPANLVLEAVSVLDGPGAFDLVLDLFAHPSAAVRAAAISRAATLDSEAFLVVASSLGADDDWSVRVSLASALARLAVPRARVLGWFTAFRDDRDVRVRNAALDGLARIGAALFEDEVFAALEAADYSERAAAARLVGREQPVGGVDRLIEAYARGQSDATPDARSAALAALARYGTEPARAVLREALSDREWPVRLQAAARLDALGETDAVPTRPAPTRQPPEFFQGDRLLHPTFSPHAYIETRHGTIELELNMVEAPVTTNTFIDLARAGFYDGLRVHRLIPHFVMQAGDPRGDGSGGPGFTMRDELSWLPFLRGTVGVALSGPDTGGSQFFITLSPQPHLDGQYTVFGRVVAGHEVLDLMTQWDVIEQVRIWDGVTLRGPS
jgi:cyclophilin family peptidyl-prolyl cis-trans isomerase